MPEETRVYLVESRIFQIDFGGYRELTSVTNCGLAVNFPHEVARGVPRYCSEDDDATKDRIC